MTHRSGRYPRPRATLPAAPHLTSRWRRHAAALPASLGARASRASALPPGARRRASTPFRRVVSLVPRSNSRTVAHSSSRRAPEAATVLPEIVASFNLATFTPQVFWLAMIFAPRHPVTRAVLWDRGFPSLGHRRHFFMDYAGFNQPGALEEAAKFGQVFDPSIPPWSWPTAPSTAPSAGSSPCSRTPTSSPRSGRTCSRGDLFVGRWMWLDAAGARRPSPRRVSAHHQLHGTSRTVAAFFFVCLLSGKGTPPAGTATETRPSRARKRVLKRRSSRRRRRRRTPARSSRGFGAKMWTELSSDTPPGGDRGGVRGRCGVGGSVRSRAARRPSRGVCRALRESRRRRPQALASSSSGARTVPTRPGSRGTARRRTAATTPLGGLRGTTFVELDAEGLRYVRECAEPILETGSATAESAQGGGAHRPSTPPGPLAAPRPLECVRSRVIPVEGSAGHLRVPRGGVAKLLGEHRLRGSHFDAPFVGKTATAAFLEEFGHPGARVRPGSNLRRRSRVLFSRGRWIWGSRGAARVKGISYYECEGV